MVTTKHKNKIPDDLRRSEVLALDVAEHTGYYSAHEMGTWNFTESARNDYKQHLAFRETLIAFIKKYNIRVITAEDVTVAKHFMSMRKLAEFRGVLFETCDELGLPEPILVNLSTIKKYATGNGKATKQDMIDYMIKKYNQIPQTDDTADACHLYYYFVNKYRLQ